MTPERSNDGYRSAREVCFTITILEGVSFLMDGAGPKNLEKVFPLAPKEHRDPCQHRFCDSTLVYEPFGLKSVFSPKVGGAKKDSKERAGSAKTPPAHWVAHAAHNRASASLIRLRAMATHFGSISKPSQRRPLSIAIFGVVPTPANGSSTTS